MAPRFSLRYKVWECVCAVVVPLGPLSWVSNPSRRCHIRFFSLVLVPRRRWVVQDGIVYIFFGASYVLLPVNRFPVFCTPLGLGCLPTLRFSGIRFSLHELRLFGLIS
jgi:hypothetical protein